MSNKVYDALKWIAQIVLPALATLYLALAGIWGLPYGQQVSGTIMAIDAFLGAILGISNARYKQRLKDEANLEEGVMDLVDAIEEESNDEEERLCR